jgi:hydroxymethylbilane synthase
MGNPVKRLRVGTRGSKLALIQTSLVTDALMALQPELEIENVIIKTEGDKNQAPIPLDTVGKAWFTAEIEAAITAGRIDLAVHSLKDLPLTTAAELGLVFTLERSSPCDAIISKSRVGLAKLPAGSVVGTDSNRRRALILAARPDLVVRSLRGNVQTRLQKLHDQDYDAIILAEAGLARLGDTDIITERLDPRQFIPAVGQGALAVQYRITDTALGQLLRQLEHQPTVTAARAERAFSAAIGGGCKLPIGCYAQLENGNIRVFGVVGEIDGPRQILRSTTGPESEAVPLAEELAAMMMEQCHFSYKP